MKLRVFYSQPEDKIMIKEVLSNNTLGDPVYVHYLQCTTDTAFISGNNKGYVETSGELTVQAWDNEPVIGIITKGE